MTMSIGHPGSAALKPDLDIGAEALKAPGKFPDVVQCKEKGNKRTYILFGERDRFSDSSRELGIPPKQYTANGRDVEGMVNEEVIREITLIRIPGFSPIAIHCTFIRQSHNNEGR